MIHPVVLTFVNSDYASFECKSRMIGGFCVIARREVIMLIIENSRFVISTFHFFFRRRFSTLSLFELVFYAMTIWAFFPPPRRDVDFTASLRGQHNSAQVVKDVSKTCNFAVSFLDIVVVFIYRVVQTPVLSNRERCPREAGALERGTFHDYFALVGATLLQNPFFVKCPQFLVVCFSLFGQTWEN